MVVVLVIAVCLAFLLALTISAMQVSGRVSREEDMLEWTEVLQELDASVNGSDFDSTSHV